MPSIFHRTNSAALAFIVMGAFWFMVGTVYGLFSAIHMVAPEFFNNIPWLVFGRVRPAHVNTVLFGFVTTTLWVFSRSRTAGSRARSTRR